MLKLIRCSNHISNIVLVLGKNKVNCVQKAIRMMRGYKNPNVWGKIKILVIMSPRERLGIQTYFFIYLVERLWFGSDHSYSAYFQKDWPQGYWVKIGGMFQIIKRNFFQKIISLKSLLPLWKAKFPVLSPWFLYTFIGQSQWFICSPLSWPPDPNFHWISYSSLKTDSLSEHHKILLSGVPISLLSHLRIKNLKGPIYPWSWWRW